MLAVFQKMLFRPTGIKSNSLHTRACNKKIRCKQHIFFKIFILSCFLISPKPAHANGYDPASANPIMRELKQNVLKIIDHKKIDKIEYAKICSMTSSGGFMIRTELGRLKFNDLYHEISSEEQKDDIRKLAESVQGRENCRENVKKWNAYDEKWYAAKREAEFAQQEQQKAAWASQVVDTGADVWDTVMNGVSLAIPREYIWFGSRQPDGYAVNVNLQFYYPHMSATPLAQVKNGKYEKTNIGGLLRTSTAQQHPCKFDKPSTDCVYQTHMTSFIFNYLDCFNLLPVDRYKINQRGGCTPKGAPTYDAEIGLYRIGSTDGYYEGHYAFPKYWLKCVKPENEYEDMTVSQICEAAVPINENLFFKYSFPRELFFEHKVIRDALKEKIRSFIVRGKELP